MFAYKKVTVSLNDSVMGELVALSKAWAEEYTCPAYYANDPGEFVNHDVYLVTDEGEIVAYALGHVYVMEEKHSYNEVGETAFELDEIVVAKAYRNRGIGKTLFRFIEQDVANRVEVIHLVATSFQYERLLHFYIEEVGMTFNHAVLVKRTFFAQ